MIFALFSAALALPNCAPLAIPAQVLSLGLQFHGHNLGGTGIVEAEADHWSLTLLSPGGLGLFTISGPPSAVETGLDNWRPWLETLPIARDLQLAFSEVPPSGCAVGGGRIRVDRRGVRHWRGPDGPARMATADATLSLTDPVRGYTLLLVIPKEEPTLAP